MTRLATFCKENEKICTKVNDNKCISYADPEKWERLGGCPLNSIPGELKRDAERAKKAADRARFTRQRRR